MDGLHLHRLRHLRFVEFVFQSRLVVASSPHVVVVLLDRFVVLTDDIEEKRASGCGSIKRHELVEHGKPENPLSGLLKYSGLPFRTILPDRKRQNPNACRIEQLLTATPCDQFSVQGYLLTM